MGRISNRKIEAICGDEHKHMEQEHFSKSFTVDLKIVNDTNSEEDTLRLCHTNPNFSQIHCLMNFIHQFLKNLLGRAKEKKESF